ncbi:MAG TPA: aminopeptidase [Candidatus Nanoarchaeia archaeon]|nr:aminopeptidase [Candidatus Nanoarchaeia archaeon]
MAKSTGYTGKESLLSNLREVYRVNLAVKKNERVLVVIDRRKRKLGRLFLAAGKDFSPCIDLMEIPVGKVNGEEPPSAVAKQMQKHDVLILLTTKSLTHTNARKNACRKGARVASLPDATEDMLKRTLSVDYRLMHKRIAEISDVLDKGKIVRIVTPAGTDLLFSIKGRRAYGRESGIFTRKGRYGNLPDGESFIAPVEGSASGVFIIDGSIGSMGMVDRPVKVFVQKGSVLKIAGGKAAKVLMKQLNDAGNKAKNIAEFGIGMNDSAKITGNMLEDEKVIGTCHIALGNNSGFGGKVDVPLHIDCLIKKPVIYIDEKLLRIP